MSGGILVVVTGTGVATSIYCIEAKDIAQQSTLHRTAPPQHSYPVQNVGGVEVGKPYLKEYSFSKYLLSLVYVSHQVLRAGTTMFLLHYHHYFCNNSSKHPISIKGYRALP